MRSSWMTWMRSYTKWTWKKNSKREECPWFCCSATNNPHICVLKLSYQTEDHAQRPFHHCDMIPSINLGKHCCSGFYGSSSFRCLQKLLFLFITGNNFSAGSEIIRTGEQHIQVCFGISTKGQWIYAAVCFITRVRWKKLFDVWARHCWINMAKEFTIMFNGFGCCACALRHNTGLKASKVFLIWKIIIRFLLWLLCIQFRRIFWNSNFTCRFIDIHTG